MIRVEKQTYENLRSPGGRRIVQDLEQQVRSGQLRKGKRLASIRELASMYSVSCGTARVAIGHLEGMSLVSRKPGSGTYVSYSPDQDIREKIIYNLYGADVWMDYVYAVNAQCDYTNADECWEAPAEALGINTTEVEELFNNETYVEELLMKEAALSSA